MGWGPVLFLDVLHQVGALRQWRAPLLHLRATSRADIKCLLGWEGTRLSAALSSNPHILGVNDGQGKISPYCNICSQLPTDIPPAE